MHAFATINGEVLAFFDAGFAADGHVDRRGLHVGYFARTGANLLARQFPGHEGGQAGRGDGVAVGDVAFDFEQVVLSVGDLFPALQVAQLQPLARLLD
ncbi:MAG: hypothetical protein ACREHD_00990 [Pirellulales bacterium]